jgi:hypothetical protein
MAFDETNYEMPPETDGDLPEESSNNRTFMIAVGILGGLILISVACLGAVYLFSSRGANTAEAAVAASNATQTEVAKQVTIKQALTATALAAQPTATLSPTPTVTPPIAPPSPTGTPDIVMTTAAGGSVGTTAPDPSTQAAATATVAAALTKAADAQKTVTMIPIPTRLAGTGFADEYGIPGLVVMALAFIIVILFARRLRASPTTR